MSTKYDKELDASGLACPMPIVKARKEISALQVGEVLRVVSTDRGSMKDFQGWAKAARNIELLAQETEARQGQDAFIHYVKRTV